MNCQTAHAYYVTFKGGSYDGRQQALESPRLTLFEPVIRQMFGEDRPIETAVVGRYEVAMDGYAYWIPA
jgi:hypothetical protein